MKPDKLKPKCDLCGNIGDERNYEWVPEKRGKMGNLLHATCATRYYETWRKVSNGLDKLLKQIIKDKI